MIIHQIPVWEADAKRTADYGITHTSMLVYRTTAASGPVRVVIWSNTARPNPHPGEVRHTKYGSIGGPGQYLDPNNQGTDSEATILITPESVVIDSNPARSTGGNLSGQQYATGARIAEGDTVELVSFPSGDVIATGTVTFKGPGTGNGHGRLVVS